jgi:hypothetical protein
MRHCLNNQFAEREGRDAGKGLDKNSARDGKLIKPLAGWNWLLIVALTLTRPHYEKYIGEGVADTTHASWQTSTDSCIN